MIVNPLFLTSKHTDTGGEPFWVPCPTQSDIDGQKWETSLSYLGVRLERGPSTDLGWIIPYARRWTLRTRIIPSSSRSCWICIGSFAIFLANYGAEEVSYFCTIERLKGKVERVMHEIFFISTLSPYPSTFVNSSYPLDTWRMRSRRLDVLQVRLAWTRRWLAIVTLHEP